MKFFLDTLNIEEINSCNELGFLDGITTNPSLVSKSFTDKKDIFSAYEKICEICKDRPVSCEVISTEYNDIMKEAKELLSIANNVCIKIAISKDGLKACKNLTDDGKMTNMTLCFTPMQALLCAKAGATFVSPFIGRSEDVGDNGIELIKKIRTIFDNYAYDTQILSASIRSVYHVEQVASIGADVATMSYKIFSNLFNNSSTESGILQFVNDYKSAMDKS